MSLLDKARKMQTEDTLATYRVVGTLKNIHGDWAAKEIEVEEKLYDVKDKKTIKEALQQGGRLETLDTEKGKTDVLFRKVREKVHAFPPDQDGHPMIPLGGVRGYLIGMFRSSARTRGWHKKDSKYYGCISFLGNGGVKIEPEWCTVTEDVEIKQHPFFVREAKHSIYFEYIEECPFEVKVTVMKSNFPPDMVLKLIMDLERIPIGPKRRGSLSIANIEEIKD